MSNYNTTEANAHQAISQALSGVVSSVMRAIVGMSGGVDSSLAAYLLRESGYEVTGISLVLFGSGGATKAVPCCSREAVAGAASTAASLGAEHVVIDARDIFIDRVITPFAKAYAKGLTPNPCVLCNREVKFPLLLAEAKARGADIIATGHFARVERTGTHTALLKGVDQKKDQSYFLYCLRPEELKSLVLPLGEMTKESVRQRARELGLLAAERPESQEICFVDEAGYAPLVRELEPDACEPGPIISPDGKAIGSHRGIVHFTIGQRKGLGIAYPVPLYVTRLEAGSRAVHVGTREMTLKAEMSIGEVNWLSEPMEKPFRAGIKVRSTTPPKPGLVSPLQDGTLRVRFDEPEFAPAPGQSAVIYDGDVVLAGGVIFA